MNNIPNTDPKAVAPSSPLPRRWWLAAGAVGVSAGLAWSWWRQDRSAAATQASALSAPTSGADRLGEDFWALSLPQPDGSPLALAGLRGRPLLVNFWATWCPPCVKEMPLLDGFYKQYAAQNMQLLGIAIDGPTAVKGFLAKTPVAFPIALAGADGTGLARTLGNQLGALPYTVLADAQGRIVQRQMGELTAAQLTEWARILGLNP